MKLSTYYGGVQTGEFWGVGFYRQGRWYLSYKMACGKLSRTIKVKESDLSYFHVKGSCEEGRWRLQISQNDLKRDIQFSGLVDEVIDMSDFDGGLIKMVLLLESVRNVNAVISCEK